MAGIKDQAEGKARQVKGRITGDDAEVAAGETQETVGKAKGKVQGKTEELKGKARQAISK
jgi:uncharacterized protein YjbJ (UPF0337 family)